MKIIILLNEIINLFAFNDNDINNYKKIIIFKRNHKKLILFKKIITEVKKINLIEKDQEDFMINLLTYKKFDYIKILVDNDKIKNLDLEFKGKRLLMHAFKNNEYKLFKNLLLKGAKLDLLDTNSKLNILITMQFINY